MLESIILDYGGVVGKDSGKEIYKEVADHFGRSEEKIEENYRRQIVQVQKGKITSEEFWDSLAEAIDVSDPEELESTWLELFEEKRELDNNLLSYLRKLKQDYVLCLLSNTTSFYSELNPDRIIDNIFDYKIESYKVGVRKPEPEIYELALRKVDSAPERTLFVDDQEKNLIRPRKMGMKVLLYRNLRSFKKRIKQ